MVPFSLPNRLQTRPEDQWFSRFIPWNREIDVLNAITTLDVTLNIEQNMNFLSENPNYGLERYMYIASNTYINTLERNGFRNIVPFEHSRSVVNENIIQQINNQRSSNNNRRFLIGFYSYTDAEVYSLASHNWYIYRVVYNTLVINGNIYQINSGFISNRNISIFYTESNIERHFIEAVYNSSNGAIVYNSLFRILPELINQNGDLDSRRFQHLEIYNIIRDRTRFDEFITGISRRVAQGDVVSNSIESAFNRAIVHSLFNLDYNERRRLFEILCSLSFVDTQHIENRIRALNNVLLIIFSNSEAARRFTQDQGSYIVSNVIYYGLVAAFSAVSDSSTITNRLLDVYSEVLSDDRCFIYNLIRDIIQRSRGFMNLNVFNRYQSEVLSSRNVHSLIMISANIYRVMRELFDSPRITEWALQFAFYIERFMVFNSDDYNSIRQFIDTNNQDQNSLESLFYSVCYIYSIYSSNFRQSRSFLRVAYINNIESEEINILYESINDYFELSDRYRNIQGCSRRNNTSIKQKKEEPESRLGGRGGELKLIGF